ncbi:MAG: 50S ribosomal protein L13 [Planctomycetaceae bacterium]|nr:50S ribosomal protein L13 [Planctomycetaceae bacterium]
MTVGQKTTFLKAADFEGARRPGWFIVDGDGQTVGRLATQIATVLMGKHRPDYTPHVNGGDFVIVVNADKVRFIGSEMVHPRHKYHSDKMNTKEYEWYTGFNSGQKQITAINLWEKKPTEILRLAVKRMLPKNALARHMLDRLKLFVGDAHPHQSQQPQPWPDHLQAK